MIDCCDLSHDAVMEALIQSQPPTDTLVTCLFIYGYKNYNDRDDDYECSLDYEAEHTRIGRSLHVMYDTSLRRSRDGHLIELPPKKVQIDVNFSTLGQSNGNKESSSTTTFHSKTEITPRYSKESDEENIDFLGCQEQSRPITLFECLIDSMLDNIQFTSSTQYTCSDSAFHFCLKYFGQALKETNLTSLDLGNRITCDLFFDFVKHLKETKIASIKLPIIDYNSEKSIRGDLAACSIDYNVKCHNLDSGDRSEKNNTLVDPSCNDEVQMNSLEYLPTILKDTEITSLDCSGNPINLKILSCSLIGGKITYLGLRGCKIKNDDLSCLARILKNTQITSINLSDNELDCESLKIFASDLEGTKITKLDFSSNKIGVDGINFLGSVLKNTQISSIDFSNNNLNGGSLDVFVNCLVDSKITSLSLKNNNIGVSNLNCLGSVLKNTQITSIDLSEPIKNKLGYENKKASLFLGLVGSKLNMLNLSHSDLDDNELQLLGDVLKKTQITGIDLSYNDLNRDRLEMFAPCLVDTKITFIALKGNKIGTRELECLKNVLRNTQITSIDFSENSLHEKIHYVLTLCSKDTKITSLGLKRTFTKHDFASSVGTFDKDTQIESIDLSDNYLKCKDSRFSCYIPTRIVSFKVTSLNISGNALSYPGMKYLASVLRNTPITSLNLENCHMNCNTLKILVMCLPDTKITTLNLSGNNTCCNIFFLAFVLKHTQIMSLNISSCCSFSYNPTSFLKKLNERDTVLDLSDKDLCTFSLCYLARILKNTKIISLNLSSIRIESDGLKYLSQGLMNSQIVELNLSSNNIDCSGAYYLAQVLRHTRISSLNLSNNKIACRGLKYLAQGLVGSKISSLDLSYNLSINDEGFQYLTKSLADTQIVELDLRYNMIGVEAAYQLCKSLRQRKVDSMHAQILNRDEGIMLNLMLPVYLSVYRYPGCCIEINQTELDRGDEFGHLINNFYRESGITKLILRNDYFPIFEGTFDNINISEIEFNSDRNKNVASLLQRSSIAKMKMNLNKCLLKSLPKMNYLIALHLEIDNFSELSSAKYFKSVLTQSNIVYLDLSNNRLGKYKFGNLVEILKCSKIISLNLSNNCLEADCIELLATALPNTKLTYIDLHGNKIGFLGFKYLTNIVDKTSICWLSLGNNNIEEGLQSDVELSPYIVPRNDTPIQFQIRYLFKELVSLNTASKQFEFIIPREDSVITINHYPRFVKHFLDTPSDKMHIYDYLYMQSMKKHDIHVLNRINLFIKEIKQNFKSFFNSKMMQIGEKFGYDCFVNLVKECDKLNCTDFVEFLLLHRVLYYVDDERNFLHPFIYKMLHKYHMPLYNDAMEPNKKQQIISYFQEHSNIDCAREIIDLLK